MPTNAHTIFFLCRESLTPIRKGFTTNERTKMGLENPVVCKQVVLALVVAAVLYLVLRPGRDGGAGLRELFTWNATENTEDKVLTVTSSGEIVVDRTVRKLEEAITKLESDVGLLDSRVQTLESNSNSSGEMSSLNITGNLTVGGLTYLNGDVAIQNQADGRPSKLTIFDRNNNGKTEIHHNRTEHNGKTNWFNDEWLKSGGEVTLQTSKKENEWKHYLRNDGQTQGKGNLNDAKGDGGFKWKIHKRI